MKKIEEKVNVDTKRTGFDFPPLWEDDSQMYDLMAGFRRPRAMEEAEYDFKVAFWRSLVERMCRVTKTVVVSEAALKETFRREFPAAGILVRPQCLGRILGHMKAEGAIVEQSSFEHKGISKTISGLVSGLYSPLKWSFNYLHSFVFLTDNNNNNQQIQDLTSGEFVLINLVPELVQNFINILCSEEQLHISPHIDAMPILSYNSLLSQYTSHQPSQTFLRNYLERNRLVEEVALGDADSESMIIVKFARSMTSPLTCKGFEKSLQDRVRGMVKLKILRSKLETDETVLESKLSQLKQEVLRSLRINKKEEAKMYLKKGKVVEKMLERKRGQMENVEMMLEQIDAADDNMQVMRALSSAASIMKAQSMDVDSVHDIMAEVGDTIADQQEINASMSLMGDSTQNDLNDLESELAALQVQDQTSEEITINFPSVPDDPLPYKSETVQYKMTSTN